MNRAALALATVLPLASSFASPLASWAAAAPARAEPVRAEPVRAEPVRAEPVVAVLADFGWLAGDWSGEKDGDRIEECWLPPAAGAMVGTFRWVRGERVIVYELLALEQRPEGVVLLLRHFGPGLAGWEEKDGALVFDLAEARDGAAVFAGRDPAKPTRLGYRKGEGGALVAFLERTRDGESTVEEFVYHRR